MRVPLRKRPCTPFACFQSALPWLSVKTYELHHAALVEVLDCPNTTPDKETALLLAACQPFTGPFASRGAAAAGGGAQEASQGILAAAQDDAADAQEAKATPALVPSDRLATLLDAIDAMIDAEWHSRATLRFYQSSELLPLLTPQPQGSIPLLDFPPVLVEASELAALKVSPLDSLLRLPATLEHVDVPLPPHDQW
ncbi:nuclear cap binding protein [Cyclospora cayetanensis]|uniref:Nuclear cap binding protein n=1 Tax=Cyclospora cayetanensis TaxID=88456 RepID=A0A1D3CQZ4_9EIME|nr:nuclear cap binding protein [Cyclospora cayetanensis]